MSKKISGQENWGELLKKYPKSAEVADNLGIGSSENDQKLSLVELAIKNKIPLQVFLNSLAKKIGTEVQWPQVSGINGANDFEKSTGLRSGRPKGLKKVIAIHSGKGGVGKTFVAIALALHAARQGQKIGLLDLDIDCPNVIKALGIKEKLLVNKNKQIEPIIYQGIRIVSMGSIQEREDLAIMWRGPILAKAIDQLVYDSNWGELDILVVDFPPGTGDAPLTFFNMLKPDGVVFVSTPSELALVDTAKSVDMCSQLQVKVLGLVENMVGDIFGENNQTDIKRRLGLDLIASVEMKKIYAMMKWSDQFDKDLTEALNKLQKKIFG